MTDATPWPSNDPDDWSPQPDDTDEHDDPSPDSDFDIDKMTADLIRSHRERYPHHAPPPERVSPDLMTDYQTKLLSLALTATQRCPACAGLSREEKQALWEAKAAGPQPPTPDQPIAPGAYATNRRDGWTADRQRRFLAMLAETGSVTRAAAAVEMSPRSAHRLRARPEARAFADGWGTALVMAGEQLIDLAFERATVGAESVTTRGGEEVRRTRTPSDRMLCFLITNLHPDRFGGSAFRVRAEPSGRNAAHELPRLATALVDQPEEGVLGPDAAEGEGAHPL